MSSLENEANHHFENEVRRIARELWPAAEYGGARMIDGRERDGVFETEDCIHLVEATVSKSMSKAQDDIKKLVTLAHQLRATAAHKAVKCWFITKSEPTADQREVANKHPGLVNALSFEQFQGKLIDVASYLNQRDKYAFGSVRDPVTGNASALIEYVPLDLIQVGGAALWNSSQIRDSLIDGKHFVVLGDYGAGKSTTLREIYRELRRSHFKQRTHRFPVYLNLRDHFGQTNAAEILERHARNLGFAHPAHLVRAWRAGFVTLLIDGFDEVTTLGIQGLWKRLKDVRYRAMEGVRDLIKNHPNGAGIILAGRAHFFDSEKERRSALNLSSQWVEVTLNEFNAVQIQQYLKRCGLNGRVPGWMPSKPLLVGYLAASGLLNEVVENGQGDQGVGPDPVHGWDLILDRVSAREADIEAGIDGATVRRILERLATVAGATEGGMGPLSPEQVVTAFKAICGYEPDERAMVLLQRLPGLGIDRAEEGTRAFLDEDLTDVCRTGDVIAFIDDPFGAEMPVFQGLQVGLGSLGISLASRKLQAKSTPCGKFHAALGKAISTGDATFLTLDVARIAIDVGCGVPNALTFDGIYVPSLELNEGMKDCSHLTFHDCYFSKIELDIDIDSARAPRFVSCYVGELDGRSSSRDLPDGVFDDTCVFEKFSEAPTTTNAIGGMDIPMASRVLLTMLKKLYLQSGGGRKESSFHRGLDHHGRRFVDPILRLLQREGLALPYKRGGMNTTIWVPDRAQTPRVAKIITSPHTCGDTLLQRAAELAKD